MEHGAWLKKNSLFLFSKCIHLIDTFTYHNHVCIVSELLGKSVFDFLKENNFFPFPCKDIWLFAKQLLRSVACEFTLFLWIDKIEMLTHFLFFSLFSLARIGSSPY